MSDADLIIDVPKIQSIATWQLHITEAGGAIMAAFESDITSRIRRSGRELAARAYWSNAHHAPRDDFARRTPKDAHPKPSCAPLGGGLAPGRTRAPGLAGRPIGHADRPWDGPRGGGLGGGELDGAGGAQAVGSILPGQRLTR